MQKMGMTCMLSQDTVKYGKKWVGERVKPFSRSTVVVMIRKYQRSDTFRPIRNDRLVSKLRQDVTETTYQNQSHAYHCHDCLWSLLPPLSSPQLIRSD